MTAKEKTLSGAIAAIEGAGAVNPTPVHPRTVAAQARAAALPPIAPSNHVSHPLLAAIHITGALPLQLADPLLSDAATLLLLPVARAPPEVLADTWIALLPPATLNHGMILGMVSISEDAVRHRIVDRIPSTRPLTGMYARAAAAESAVRPRPADSPSNGVWLIPCIHQQCSVLEISGADDKPLLTVPCLTFHSPGVGFCVALRVQPRARLRWTPLMPPTARAMLSKLCKHSSAIIVAKNGC